MLGKYIWSERINDIIKKSKVCEIPESLSQYVITKGVKQIYDISNVTNECKKPFGEYLVEFTDDSYSIHNITPMNIVRLLEIL